MIPKFRAWDKRHKHMIEVTSISFRDGTIQEETRYAVNRKLYLDDFVLMQSSGVKDINNIEIFEGDIVKGQIVVRYKRTGLIQFKNGAFRFNEFWHEGFLTMYEDSPEGMDFYYNLEVIGNKYENPELLEEDSE